jgi:parallel beta-helix repeat protein/putative cofactor-binding repeat protein
MSPQSSFRTTVILIGFAFELLSASARATTYYLDSTSGNNMHGGTEITQALKTLRSANTNLYHPGDQIMLKAGSVWRGETLQIATSGESGEPITISSYGIGPQPVLEGANSSSPPITLLNAHNVVVSNLTIQNASRLILVEDSSNVTIRNCTLMNASLYGIDMKRTTGFTVSNNTYTTTGTFKQAAGGAIRISAQVAGVTVTGNKVTFNGASKAGIGIYIFDVNNAVVSGNTVIGGSQGIGIKGYTRSVTGAQIFNNAVYYSDQAEGDGEGIELTGWKYTPYRVSGSIHHNFIRGGPETINAIAGYQAPNSAVYNNIIIGPVLNAAIHWSTSSPGGLFYGNTVYNVPIAFGVYSGCSATIRNNIVSKAQTTIWLDRGTAVEDYNIFYASGASGVTKGGHTTTADPRFISSNPVGPLDVKLQTGSPAIHSGAHLSSAFAMALDPASTRFPCALLNQSIYGWGRGAFGHK